MLLVKIDRVGRYEVDESFAELLDEFAADVVSACESDDPEMLRERLEDLTCLVVAAGEPASAPLMSADCRQIPRIDAAPTEVRLRLHGFTAQAGVAA